MANRSKAGLAVILLALMPGCKSLEKRKDYSPREERRLYDANYDYRLNSQGVPGFRERDPHVLPQYR